MIRLMIAGILIGGIWAESGSYRPSGWRPDGPMFEPIRHERLQTYGVPSRGYGVSANIPYRPRQPEQTTNKPPTTISPPPTTTTTTTPRSRESTTPNPDINDDDVETGPALAIANSFAFNRPVYIYNTYPFHSGLTFV